MAAVLRHVHRQQSLGFFTGSRHSAAEQGIVLFPNHIHITPAGQQNGTKGVVADTVHGVNGNPQTAFLDFFHINGIEDAVDVFIKGICFPDDSGFQPLRIGDAFHIRRSQLFNFCFNVLCHILICIPAAGSENLNAVINGGIVAGSHRHAIGKPHLLDGKHHQRGGNRAVDHIGAEAIACQNLCCPEHGLLGQKTAVIAQADFLASMAFPEHQIAEACCQQPDIFLGELIRNDGTPAAGTEFDHLLSPLFQGCHNLSIYSIPQSAFFHQGEMPYKKARPFWVHLTKEKPPDRRKTRQVVIFIVGNRRRPSGSSPGRFWAATHNDFCPHRENDAP